eukprot:15851825-Heterocapsa_arctica.AAC.1
MPFQTANGLTVSTHSAPMRICEFGEDITPFVLQDTPAVLSVGDRTMNKGYTFVWPAYSNPYFVTPNGFRVELGVRDNIPYLRRGSVRSVPAEVPNHGAPLTPRRSRPALSALDLGGGLGIDMDLVPVMALVPDGGAAGHGDVIGDPPVPPPPAAPRRDLKDVAMSLETMLNHKPANPNCDACLR